MSRRLAALLVAVGLALAPAAALAHGEHGGAERLGGGGVVTVGGWQIELLSHPAPLARGQRSHVVAKVLTAVAQAPASGGEVAIGLAPAGTAPEVRPATETTWAGNYGLELTPAGTGEHVVRVVLGALGGRRLEPPLVVDFPVAVERAPGLGPAAWTVLALVALLAALAVYAARLRPAPALDLLAIPWLRRLLTSRAFQRGLQGAALALTAVVAWLGFADVQDGGVNLATKLTWTIWWAGVIFTFVLAGRVWCVACPFGALNEWTARASGAWRRLPRPFRNIWWATGAFVLLTWADEQLGVVRSPQVTGWIIVFFLVLAVAVGLVYERRSFCRHLCPIGVLIGIYSMTAPLELRARDAGTCRTHAEKGCYQGTADSAGCPMFEFPQAMDRNNYCTLCVECVKGCARDNLAIRFRAFGKDLWATRRRVLDEAYLAVALVGLTLLVTAQMLPAWPAWMSALARWLPAAVRSGLKPVTYLTLVESAVLLGGALVLTPLLVLAGAALADRLAGPRGLGPRRTFVVFAYMFVPVGLAVHLAHNLAHLLLEGGGIVPVVQRAVALWTPFALGEPDWRGVAAAPDSVVSVLQVAVLVAFFVLSLVAGHRLAAREYADPRAAGRAIVPFVLLSLAFTVAGLVLLQQPMGMRHGM